MVVQNMPRSIGILSSLGEAYSREFLRYGQHLDTNGRWQGSLIFKRYFISAFLSHCSKVVHLFPFNYPFLCDL